MTDMMLQTELLLRLFLAVICGGAIGYERKNRGKGAGIRTHIIVSVASCLMMIISQYGFKKFFMDSYIPGVDLKFDPSRIGAQIVSGIGFLGAGMIFVQQKTVTGLTTAAGIWATAGIGMAIGCGMYFIAISCMAIIVIIQVILHKNLRILRIPAEVDLLVSFTGDETEYLEALFDEFGICIESFEFKRHEEELTEACISIQIPGDCDKTVLIKRIYENKNILMAKI